MTTAKLIDKVNISEGSGTQHHRGVGFGDWSNIDWKKVEKEVFRLQKRIYRASQNGNTNCHDIKTASDGSLN